ncbi:uncharacterized protein LOC106647666 [Copidosoma floridanum]|uniref:uncharacterized protein LOC106647666 n=1 Tax=Copidosoma floridanum TaxID=29053 RepID=UPI0006C99BAA|nr:uncharacterized protein LOC106647666 [Copidosoma floridanum]
MLKLFSLSRCSMCTMVQMAPKTYKMHDYASNFEEMKTSIMFEKYSNHTRNRQMRIVSSQENFKAIKAILEKYHIDMSNIQSNKLVFNETQWNVEKKILLLQELGVEKITTGQIVNFVNQLYLAVPLYKASLGLAANVNIAERLLSTAQSSKIDCKALNHLDENMTMKTYYSECFNYYVKEELGLTPEEVRRVSTKKFMPTVYNSFRLLQRLLILIQKDYNLSKVLVLRHFGWLLAHHPDHGLKVINALENNFKELDVYKVISRCPKVINYDIGELNSLITYMNKHGITGQMIQSAPEVFNLSSTEFMGRMETLMKNPFTLVYKKHPRFLLLVRDYQISLPRIKYLQEQNIKYASIHSLTTFHNYLDQLVTTRKLKKLSITSFLKLHFNKDSEELYKGLKRHPHHLCVSLLQINETLSYLKEVYPKDVICKHIYAILYSVTDLKAAREEVLKDPEYSNLSPQHNLSMCLYKVDSANHFTGNAVLTPDKYAESLEEEAHQEEENEEK